MKTLKTLVLAMVMVFTLVVSVGAYTLSWDASDGATGYKVYYNTVDTPDDIMMVDRGSALSYDLDSASLLMGVRYEFWATAYNETGESPESDHIRWTTPPSEPVIIEMMSAPVQIIINP